MPHHPCLNIQEILTNIFEHVPERATLAALARTCKTFSDPALDSLWYSQSSVIPLIKCLPSDVYILEHPHPIFDRSTLVSTFKYHILMNLPHSTFQRIIRTLVPSDYDRVHHYSYRIRRMDLPPRDSQDYLLSLDDRILDIVSSNPEGGPLFPRLNHLCVSLSSFDVRAYHPRLVIGKALRSISIDFTGENFMERLDRCAFPPSLWHNIHFILSSATGLTSFTADATWNGYYRKVLGDFGPQPALLQLYCTFHHLEEFCARPSRISHQVLSHLAALPKLRKVVISIHSADLEKFTLTHPSERIFDSIVEFGIETNSLVAVQNLLKRRGFEVLECLRISRRPVHRTWELDPFFDTLRRCKGTVPLKALSVTQAEFLDRGRSTSGITSPVSDLYTFASLVSFSDLRVVEINLNGVVAVDDRELGRLADAWPRLEVLMLAESPEGVTLLGLVVLASSCPELRHLTLRVNATGDVPNVPQDCVPGLKLVYFHTLWSCVDLPMQVADFLHVVFPNLVDLKWTRDRENHWTFNGEYYADLCSPWRRVKDRLMVKHNAKVGKRIAELGV